MVDLWFDVVPLQIFDTGDVDFIVKVTDVTHDRLVTHFRHVRGGDDVFVTRGGDENVGGFNHVFEGHHAVAFHSGLQRANRVDLSDENGRAETAQRLRRAFAHVAVAADHRDFTGDHHVGRALDTVDQ